MTLPSGSNQSSGNEGPRRSRTGWWVLIGVVAIAAAAFGYWRYVYYPTTPQYALREFLDAAKKEDYATCYKRLRLPVPLKLIIPTAEDLENTARSAGGLIPRLEDYRLGKVTRTGDKASIVTVLVARQHDADKASAEEITVEMVWEDDRWKVDGGWAMEEMIRRGADSLRKSLLQRNPLWL